MKTCRYCHQPQEDASVKECDSQFFLRGTIPGNSQDNPFALRCSRPKGHKGDHVACTHSKHPFQKWPRLRSQA